MNHVDVFGSFLNHSRVRRAETHVDPGIKVTTGSGSSAVRVFDARDCRLCRRLRRRQPFEEKISVVTLLYIPLSLSFSPVGFIWRR